MDNESENDVFQFYREFLLEFCSDPTREMEELWSSIYSKRQSNGASLQPGE